MNGNKIMRMKKLYKEQDGIKKLEELYYMSCDIVTDRFKTMFSMLDDILDMTNTVIAQGKTTDPEIEKAICDKYDEFDNHFDDTMEEMKLIKTGKHPTTEKSLSEYKNMYLRIVTRVLGKKAGRSERLAYVTCLVASEVVRYKRFMSDYVNDCCKELSLYYEEIAILLDTIKGIEEDVEGEISEETDDVQYVSYISKVRDLEKMATEMGYILKSQNGSHKKYENPETGKCTTIPFHRGKDLGLGLSKAIQKQLMDGITA